MTSLQSIFSIHTLLPYILCFILCQSQFTTEYDEEEDDEDEYCPFDEAQKNESGLIIGMVIIYIICVICASLIAINLFKFYKNRDDPNIENRHPRLVYCTVILVIFSNIVLFPLAIDYWTLECVTHTRWLRQQNLEIVPIEAFMIVTFVFVLLGWLNLVVLRVWLLRYDYAASLARKAQIWKKDLGIDGGSSTWWIHHQQTWGREAYLFKIVAAPYFISVILCIALSPLLVEITGIDEWTPMISAVGGISIILCGFVVVNVWKVRSIHDNFHIKDEVLLFSKSSVGIATVLVIIYLFSRLFDTNIGNYIVMIWGILVMFMLTIVSLIQTAWVLYGIRRKNEKSEKLVKSINNEWESNVSLDTVLKSKEGFEVFMDFLVAEYSTENLLCYVEATQFLMKWKHVIYKMKCLIVEKQKPQHSKSKKDVLEQSMGDIMSVNNDDDENKFDLAAHENGQRLVKEATIYVHKHMDKEKDFAQEDDEIDGQPWLFHDKESILIKFEWVKRPPVMKEENVTLWDHFKHLRQKYISATSAHQVNIRSALYKHYTRIKREDCDLSKLDISDVFNDPTHGGPSVIGLSPGISPASPSGAAELSTTYTNLSEVHLDDDNDGEDQSLQPGQIGHDKSPKRQSTKNVIGNNNRISSKYHIELSERGGSTTSVVRRSQTHQYNRNLRNLYGVAKVLQLIEDTRKELWKNMNDSFVRFRSTESYVNYIKKVYVDRKEKSISNQASQDNLYIGIDSD